MSTHDTLRCDIPFVYPVGIAWQTKDFTDHIGIREYHIASDGTVWMLVESCRSREIVRLPSFSDDLFFFALVDGTLWEYWAVVERGRVTRVVQTSPQHEEEDD
jgi:hypothetical protein